MRTGYLERKATHTLRAELQYLTRKDAPETSQVRQMVEALYTELARRSGAAMVPAITRANVEALPTLEG
jgi:hypothetical protein